MEEILLLKDGGTGILLNMTVRLIERRAWEDLPPELVQDCVDKVIYDPFGKEHPEDCERWLITLEEAMELDRLLYCVLMITRFAGTKLVDGGAYWKLEPIYHKQDGRAWWTEQRWQQFRREVLMYYKDKLQQLLLKNGR